MFSTVKDLKQIPWNLNIKPICSKHHSLEGRCYKSTVFTEVNSWASLYIFSFLYLRHKACEFRNTKNISLTVRVNYCLRYLMTQWLAGVGLML